MENPIAQNKPSTEKLLSSPSTIKTIAPLMTNKNKPSVRMVIGKVKKVKIGLINELARHNKIDTTIAVMNPSICTPDKIADATKTNNPFSRREVNNLMIFKFLG